MSVENCKTEDFLIVFLYNNNPKKKLQNVCYSIMILVIAKHLKISLVKKSENRVETLQSAIS